MFSWLRSLKRDAKLAKLMKIDELRAFANTLKQIKQDDEKAIKLAENTGLLELITLISSDWSKGKLIPDFLESHGWQFLDQEIDTELLDRRLTLCEAKSNKVSEFLDGVPSFYKLSIKQFFLQVRQSFGKKIDSRPAFVGNWAHSSLSGIRVLFHDETMNAVIQRQPRLIVLVHENQKLLFAKFMSAQNLAPLFTSGRHNYFHENRFIRNGGFVIAAYKRAGGMRDNSETVLFSHFTNVDCADDPLSKDVKWVEQMKSAAGIIMVETSSILA